MQGELLEELSRDFKWGFLFDSITEVLEKYKASGCNITEPDKYILRKALEFLEIINEGREQVSSGRLGRNALESIGAYKETISVFLTIPEKEKDFKKFIEKLENIIERVANKQKVDPEDVDIVKNFFYQLSIKTLAQTYRKIESPSIYPERFGGWSIVI